MVLRVRDVFLILERVARDGEELVEGQAGVPVQERGRGVGGCEARDAGGERGGGGDGWVGVWVREGEDPCDVAGVGAQVEDVRELALDVLGKMLVVGQRSGIEVTNEEALAEPGGDFVFEIVDLPAVLGVCSGAFFLQVFGVAVEDLEGGGAGGLDGVTAGDECSLSNSRRGEVGT